MLAREAQSSVGDFNSQGLANTAWAFATLGQLDAQLFTALAREAERSVDDFNPQELANTAWAFATLGQLDAQLFMALARQAELCGGNFVGNFKPQGLANTAWALSQLQCFTGAWSFFEHMKCAGTSVGLHCFAPLFIECEHTSTKLWNYSKRIGR